MRAVLVSHARRAVAELENAEAQLRAEKIGTRGTVTASWPAVVS
jgi:hypothetical protein